MFLVVDALRGGQSFRAAEEFTESLRHGSRKLGNRNRFERGLASEQRGESTVAAIKVDLADASIGPRFNADHCPLVFDAEVQFAAVVILIDHGGDDLRSGEAFFDFGDERGGKIFHRDGIFVIGCDEGSGSDQSQEGWESALHHEASKSFPGGLGKARKGHSRRPLCAGAGSEAFTLMRDVARTNRFDLCSPFRQEAAETKIIMGSKAKKSRRHQLFLKSLLVLGAALIVLGLLGTAGYHVFTGWRARDLAAKAKENFGQDNYRIAWLQINSAKELRGEDPEVLRVLGMIEGAMGRASALDHYAKLSSKTDLTPEDLQSRAEIATRYGSEEQFAEAVDALEKSGKTTEAGALRTARKVRKGDIDRAIREARAAAASSDDPALQLDVARLLVRRYRPEFGAGMNPSAEALAGSAEVLQIVEALLATPLRKQALAFALNDVNASPADRQRWAVAAMENIEADNPALLPAAAELVRSGQKTPGEIHEQMRPVFDAAPLARRAAYALWLTGAGMPKESLTLITAQEAGESTAAFGARTEALFAMKNLDGVLSAVEAGGNVDADVRLAAKARAEYARGRGVQGGAAALREAMDAAARAGRLEFLLPTGDALGASNVVDEKLAELCGDPGLSDDVFRVVRNRFGRSGRVSLLAAAFERARTASPRSPAVLDYARYVALTSGQRVPLEETAAACAAEPSNATFRITHALNLLQNGQPAEALRSFDDITVFADRLPPGQLAVIAAVLAAAGDTGRARVAADALDPALLSPGEYLLVAPLRAAGN